jgi:hypothetical protein
LWGHGDTEHMRRWRSEHPQLVAAFRRAFCHHTTGYLHTCLTQADKDLINGWVTMHLERYMEQPSTVPIDFDRSAC